MKKCFLFHKNVVVSKNYKVEDFFKTYPLNIYDIKELRNSYYISLEGVTIGRLSFMDVEVFQKKACLKCNTCLDEYNLGLKYYKMLVDKIWLRHCRRKKVDEICGGE